MGALHQQTIVDQLWYYRALVAFFSTRHPGLLVEDLSRAVSELEGLAAGNTAGARSPLGSEPPSAEQEPARDNVPRHRFARCVL